ncbi:HEAT repeat domain-containing protein [Zunongwangia sp. F363]|uniref:HEAT repeat domain-containing protein n=1 Tax=Autumnicola tepida TaxID=3075595 RepID=A0ABU3CCI0_9FLAO|nr:HEAT repeat domain-containing protein [Zunongwangia sp. F363]MDT0643735.1 HEAT repeat domain-containing protein [Zunongwangia sp. F363]
MEFVDIIIPVLKIGLTILGVLWLSTFISMGYRKNRIRKLKVIEETFADVVSNYLYPNPASPLELLDIQRILRNIGIRESKKGNVQYLINLMIRTQRSILGNNHTKLKTLYSQIPPYRASISKLKKFGWYSKALGIREIYEMNQQQYIQEIIPLRNHKNLYVRREAQIALIVFLGWDSLRFIPYLKKGLTLWQQIKIVEKLYDLYKEPQVGKLRPLYSTKKIFAKQLIMRIIRKYSLESEVDYILAHLHDTNYEVREAAIYCLDSFKVIKKEKVEVIKSLFQKIPSASQQGQLLNYISNNSAVDVEFYMSLLRSSSDDIKLRSAEILWNSGYKEQVQEFYLEQYSNPEVYAG